MPGAQKDKKHKAGAGRPPLSAAPTVRVTVTLPAPLVERLRELGAGNVSAGVRRLLAVTHANSHQRQETGFQMKLTPAQERTLWEIDRARMGDRSTSGREGWVVNYHWPSPTLRVLKRYGLLEYAPPDEFGQPRFLVRLTPAGSQRVPTL